MRPRIRANCWLCVLISLAVAASGISSPIRSSQASGARACPDFLSRHFTLVSGGHGLTLTATTPGRESVDADNSDFDEEDDYESLWSFSHPIHLTFIASASPPSLLSGPPPRRSLPRTADVPLRC